MNKVKSNALWNELSQDNRKILDDWLFEKNQGYAEVLAKARSELGFRGSMGSLMRYRKRREAERLLTGLEELARDAAVVGQGGADADALRGANMRVLNAYLFRALREDPEGFQKLVPAARVMLQNDRNETICDLKNRELELRGEAMAFAKERRESALMERVLKAMAQSKVKEA